MTLLVLFGGGPVVVTAPTVVTNTATGIGQTTAAGNGTISSTGNENPSIRGFEYNTVPYADKVVSATGSFSAGAFQLTLTGLTPGQTYFFRAFATNSAGTGYGDWFSFVAISSSYAISIGGVDRTSDIINESLTINDELNDKQNTAQFRLVDRSGNGIPDNDEEVIITLPDGTRLFGGYTLNKTLSSIRETGVVMAAIQCVDYVRLLDGNLVNKSYTSMTDKEIIEDIVATYATGKGITTNNVIEGVTIDQINFNYVQPSQALRRISDLTGRNWYLDYDKDLHYFPLATNTAPFDLTDTPVAVTTSYIDESMASTPSGTLKGVAAYVAAATSYLLLTGAFNSQYGQLEYSNPLANAFTAEFDFLTGNGGTPPNAADAIWFYFGCSGTANSEDEGAGYGGYLVAYDEYNDQIQLWFNGTMLTSVAQTGLDNATLRLAKIVVNGTSIKIYLDGSLKIDYTDTARTLPGTKCGVGARTGGFNNQHRLYRLNVYSTSTSTNATDYHNLTISEDASQLKNRVYVRGGTKLSDPTTFSQKGDGTQRKFPMPDKPHDITLTVNGVSKTVGIKNVDAAGTYQWFVNFQEKYVEQDASQTVLSSTDVLAVTYSYDIPILVAVEDTASIAAHGQKEFPIFDKTISTQQAARDRASAELTDYANNIIEGSFKTYTNGFRTGQYLTINLAAYGINAQYIVQRVVAHSFGAGKYYYEVSIASSKTMGIIRFLLELLEANNKLVEVNDQEVVDNLLSIADSLNSDSLTDNLTIDSAGPYATWCTDSVQSTPNTRARWDLFQWG